MEQFMPKSTSYVIVRMIQYQTVITLAQLQLNLMFKAPQGQDEVCARMVTPDGRRLYNSVQQHVEKL